MIFCIQVSIHPSIQSHFSFFYSTRLSQQLIKCNIHHNMLKQIGIVNVIQSSTIHLSTFFIGLGVLSFAFVCQDSSFIIASSLDRPTKKRWAMVTKSSLSLCTVLAIIIGVTGFLGFQSDTRGNVLENFLVLPKSDLWMNNSNMNIYTYQAINVARTLLGCTMFFVYPCASYVGE